MGDLLNTAKGAIDPMTGDIDPMAFISKKRRTQLEQDRKSLETLFPQDAQDGSEETTGSKVMSTFGNVIGGRVSPLEALLGAMTGQAAAPTRRGKRTPLDLIGGGG